MFQEFSIFSIMFKEWLRKLPLFTIQEAICHDGAKVCQAIYLGDMCRVATVGFGQHSERQIAVWDDANLSKPLRRDTIDNSSGVLVPFYDHDTKLLFVAGKVGIITCNFF